jgi:serpin B
MSIQFADDVNDFSFNLYRKLSVKPGNVVASPKNILDCLAMIYAGAMGETATAMQDACLFPADPDVVCQEISQVNKALAEQKDCTIRTANGVWAQQGYPYNPAFTDALVKKYGAEFREVNYKDESTYEAIAAEANKWVEGVTKGEDGEGKIKDLLNKDFFSPESVLTLVSAIYFLGKWQSEFHAEDTKTKPFKLADGGKADCKMMTQQGDFRYYENERFQMVDLPYVGDELRMAVFLPKVKKELGKLERWLNADTFTGTIQATVIQDVILHLPKWKVTGSYDLKAPLVELGLEVAFSDEADFSGMIDETSDGDGLKISKAIHKAFVDVTEKGTEAAAATATGMMMITSVRVRPKPKVFKADHPFIYVLHHVPSGTALFLGRQSNPEGY